MLPRLAISYGALVLSPAFMAMHSPMPMTAASALLATTPPYRPSEDALGVGRTRPDQTPQQPAQFGHGVGQQLQPQSELDWGLRF
ncbi:MAG: hypothetical protein JO189_27960 [Deltaproteobacteria bacterium]|nr:hypothetical protein [Deltaproteobacteria bacterium]